MRRADFEALVRRLTDEVPPGFLEGVTSIEVTGKAVPHPLRAGVYTLGECLPHVFGGPDDEGAALRSTVFLHYGSFARLARDAPGFDWRHEAWETLTHELRHHLEWRARVPALEALDDAVEANYARHDGEPFPALFYRDGESVGEEGRGREGERVFKVEDDIFIEREHTARDWKRLPGTEVRFDWHGSEWVVALPSPLSALSPRRTDILFLTVRGVEPEPAGDLVLVLRKRPGAMDLLRRAEIRQGEAAAVSCAPRC